MQNIGETSLWQAMEAKGLVAGSHAFILKPALGAAFELLTVTKNHKVKRIIGLDGEDLLGPTLMRSILSRTNKWLDKFRERGEPVPDVIVDASDFLIKSPYDDDCKLRFVPRSEYRCFCLFCNGLLKSKAQLAGQDVWYSDPDGNNRPKSYTVDMIRGNGVYGHWVRWLPDHDASKSDMFYDMTRFVDATTGEGEFKVGYHMSFAYDHPHYHIFSKDLFQVTIRGMDHQMDAFTMHVVHDAIKAFKSCLSTSKKKSRRNVISLMFPIDWTYTNTSIAWRWVVILSAWLLCHQPNLTISANSEEFDDLVEQAHGLHRLLSQYSEYQEIGKCVRMGFVPLTRSRALQLRDSMGFWCQDLAVRLIPESGLSIVPLPMNSEVNNFYYSQQRCQSSKRYFNVEIATHGDPIMLCAMVTGTAVSDLKKAKMRCATEFNSGDGEILPILVRLGEIDAPWDPRTFSRLALMFKVCLHILADDGVNYSVRYKFDHGAVDVFLVAVGSGYALAAIIE